MQPIAFGLTPTRGSRPGLALPELAARVGELLLIFLPLHPVLRSAWLGSFEPTWYLSLLG